MPSLLAVPFEHPLTVSVLTALIASCIELDKQKDLSVEPLFYRFNNFPFWIVLIVFTICSFFARLFNSQFFAFVTGYCFHRSHKRKDLHPVVQSAELRAIDRSERGVTTATPVSPDLSQIPFRR